MKDKGIELNPELDLETDTANLQREFKRFAPLRFRYSERRADAGSIHDLAKGKYEEVRAEVYVEIKKSGDKVTEKHLEALIETDKRVRAAFEAMVEAKRDFETVRGYVDSLDAKKDMLVQLGADARKE